MFFNVQHTDGKETCCATLESALKVAGCSWGALSTVLRREIIYAPDGREIPLLVVVCHDGTEIHCWEDNQ